MKLKKLTALLCASAVVCAALTGCGGSDTGSGNGGTAQTSSTDDGAEADSAGGGTEAEGSDEIVTLHVWGFGDAKSDELDKVSAAISEITREKIGVEVDLYRTSDTEKLTLALNSGEALDLVCMQAVGIQPNVEAGNLLPIEDLYKEYAVNAPSVITQAMLDSGYVGDQIYLLPAVRQGAQAAGFSMRKDIAEELGVDLDKIYSLEDMHDVLMQAKEAHPELSPLVPSWSQGGMCQPFALEWIYGELVVLNDLESEDVIFECLYETDTYKEFINAMYQWNQDGLIMPDALTTTDNNPIATIGFATFNDIRPGKDLEDFTAHGQEVVSASITKPFSTTLFVRGMWAIPSASERPDKAMELYDLMLTDPEISQLFVNGIEGEHYVYTDDSKTFIRLPDGVTDSGYTSLDWAWPNSRITTLWEGAEPDLNEQKEEFMKNADISPAMGFAFSAENVMNEITACQNVASKYVNALKWGVVNPEEAYPKFIDELKTAGIDAIVADAQKQYDDWSASIKAE